MRRVVLKSPVRENCTPGSVRGALGNQRPYLANAKRGGMGADLAAGKTNGIQLIRNAKTWRQFSHKKWRGFGKAC